MRLGQNGADLDIPVSFSPRNNFDGLDWSSLIETPAIHLRKEAPLELAVSIFQKMVYRNHQSMYRADYQQNSPYILFSQEGRLVGIMTKSDIMNLLFPDTVEMGSLPNLAFTDRTSA